MSWTDNIRTSKRFQKYITRCCMNAAVAENARYENPDSSSGKTVIWWGPNTSTSVQLLPFFRFSTWCKEILCNWLYKVSTKPQSYHQWVISSRNQNDYPSSMTSHSSLNKGDSPNTYLLNLTLDVFLIEIHNRRTPIFEEPNWSLCHRYIKHVLCQDSQGFAERPTVGIWKEVNMENHEVKEKEAWEELHWQWCPHTASQSPSKEA